MAFRSLFSLNLFFELANFACFFLFFMLPYNADRKMSYKVLVKFWMKKITRGSLFVAHSHKVYDFKQFLKVFQNFLVFVLLFVNL